MGKALGGVLGVLQASGLARGDEDVQLFQANLGLRIPSPDIGLALGLDHVGPCLKQVALLATDSVDDGLQFALEGGERHREERRDGGHEVVALVGELSDSIRFG